MPSPTTTRGLLGHFPRGMDPPANDRRVTTPSVRLPTYLSLQAISASRAGGRSARGGASDCTGLREEGRGGTGEGGRNNDARGGPRGATDTGLGTTARKRTTMEAGRGPRGHNAQVSSVGDRGERCGACNGERESDSEELSAGSSK